ncbi:MAG: DivIVA domain-containing protein, partial [Actinobacteria bacterium]|nr:DivIVA domain-containing protein [Actinomycetota bacterium]
MPLSPDEIQTKEFEQAMRGYDKDQVRAFLNTVASDYRAALRLGNYEAVGEEVGRILQTVNDSAAALRQKATTEAEEILSQAEAEAKSMRDSASDDAAKLKNQAEVEAQGLREHTNQQVKELTEEAERRVVELEAQVRKDTEDRIREANERVESLRQAERDLRGRLDRARDMLAAITGELDEPSGTTTAAPETEAVSLSDDES